MSDLLRRARAGHALSDLDVVDMHGHLGPYPFGVPDNTPAALVAAMDRIGVSCILCSHSRVMSADTEYGNARILDAMCAFPGRILGYAAFWPDDASAIARRAAYWLDAGFSGLKFHNVTGFRYVDEAFGPALELANERAMPALFHVWGEDDVIADIIALAKRYPDTSMLLAHTGSANTEAYIRAARDCPNVYAELAYSRSPQGLVAQLVEGAGADKVVYGSDATFFAMSKQIGKVLGAQIPDDDKLAILSRNARRILSRARVAPLPKGPATAPGQAL